MAACPACGAPVVYHRAFDATRMMLDSHETTVGDPRYILVDGIATPVRQGHPDVAYTDHRQTCPQASDLRPPSSA